MLEEDNELLTASAAARSTKDCRGPLADRRPLLRMMMLACNVDNGGFDDIGIVR